MKRRLNKLRDTFKAKFPSPAAPSRKLSSPEIIEARLAEENIETKLPEIFPEANLGQVVPQSAVLCETCQSSMANLANLRNVAVHHEKFSGWIRALSNGCYICCCLEEHLRDERYRCLFERRGTFEENPVSRISVRSVASTPSSYFHLVFELSEAFFRELKLNQDGNEVSEIPPNVLELYMFREADFSLDAMRIPGSPSTNSAQTISLARCWIADCTEHHEHCKVKTVPDVLPTRLLDLGNYSASSRQVRLTSTTHGVAGHYMTLSYCWGRQSFLRLTVDNVQALETSISVFKLPRTFRDAIEITNRMGIRYLWIDSLCIIQDGDEFHDWKVESVRMNAYYSNAYCNLCASASTNVEGGLFRERQLHGFHPRILNVKLNSDAKTERLFIIEDRNLSAKTRYAPLSRRAWALQERLLAQRNLHFYDDHIAFECASFMANERFPFGVPGYSTNKFVFQSANQKDLNPSSTRNEEQYWYIEPQYRAYEMWQRTVFLYTRASLSVQTDKPVAILSIAKRYEQILNDKYILGLWRDDMVRQLLWYQVRDPARKEEITPPAEYKLMSSIPSWSWLSQHLPVTWSRMANWQTSTEWEDELYISVEEIHESDSATFSVLEEPSSRLRLLCNIFQVGFVMDEEGYVILKYDDQSLRYHVTRGARSWTIDTSLDTTVTALETPRDKLTSFVLPIRSYVTGANCMEPNVQELQFLIVEPVAGSSGAYRRVGYMHWQNRSPTEIALPKSNVEQPIESIRYDDKLGKHEIWLV